MYMYNVIYVCINFIKYLSVLELTYLFLIFHDYRWILVSNTHFSFNFLINYAYL